MCIFQKYIFIFGADLYIQDMTSKYNFIIILKVCCDDFSTDSIDFHHYIKLPLNFIQLKNKCTVEEDSSNGNFIFRSAALKNHNYLVETFISSMSILNKEIKKNYIKQNLIKINELLS